MRKAKICFLKYSKPYSFRLTIMAFVNFFLNSPIHSSSCQFVMKYLAKIIPLILISLLLFTCKKSRLGNATREDKNGWIYLHLAGSPADIGYQHGYLAANEIDTLIKVMQYYLPSSSGKDWAFYRAAVKRFMWKKID